MKQIGGFSGCIPNGIPLKSRAKFNRISEIEGNMGVFRKNSKFLIAALLPGLAVGCTTTKYRERADREVYEAIASKRTRVPGLVGDLSIEQTDDFRLQGLPKNEVELDYLGELGEAEVGANVLSLEKALEVAFNYSRTHQNRKESLYLEALNLTLDRYRFSPIFSGRLSGEFQRDTVQVERLSGAAQDAIAFPGLFADIGELTGAPGDLINAYANLIDQAAFATGLQDTHTAVFEDQSVRGTTQFGVDMLLKGGGRIALGITGNFLRFVTGAPRENAATTLTASITQPILQGAGRKVAQESLTQAERDLLYELRDFTRFRKEFSVQIASTYYSVLQARDRVRNDWLGLQNFELSARRGRAMAEEGRTSQADLGRLEQQVLNAESRWIGSVRAYERQLDQFKILLGLSTDAPVILDDLEFEVLTERGIIHPELSAEDAITIALGTRLDLYTQRELVEDADRRVFVAANALKPGLDLFLAADVNNRNPNQPFEYDFDRIIVTGGADIELPLDRKAERNAYRASLIQFERFKRDLELAEDNVKLDVRDAWRSLDEARRNYEIRLQGVELNQRRVEEQELLSELGRADAINLVDATNDLISAQNDLTAALISHRIAYLQFWRDIGILFIKENGQWEEIVDVDQS